MYGKILLDEKSVWVSRAKGNLRSENNENKVYKTLIQRRQCHLIVVWNYGVECL